MHPAIALDLGSTRFKTALTEPDGMLSHFRSIEAPSLKGSGLIREGDALEYIKRATELLRDSLAGLSKDTPIGIASQRSSFLLWDKASGLPATPLISWQDRRALHWCEMRRDQAKKITEHTGLVWSPHYAGPKLAELFSADLSLKRAAEKGILLFGTLETFLLWKLSNKKIHQTDLSMAARTMLTDPRQGEWSGELLDYFGVPETILPSIKTTWGRNAPLEIGGIVCATIADQSASIIGAADATLGGLIINLGTGGFVIRPTGRKMLSAEKYLSFPVFQSPNNNIEFALEGTINAISDALSKLHNVRISINEEDTEPNFFCLPDSSGTGAPYWRADVSTRFSKDRSKLNTSTIKRAIMEGIIFRACQISEDLFRDTSPPSKIILSGGMAQEEFIQQGLTACLGLPVRVLHEKEATLKGAGLLALNALTEHKLQYHTVMPDLKSGYLKEKFIRWKKWTESELNVIKSKI